MEMDSEILYEKETKLKSWISTHGTEKDHMRFVLIRAPAIAASDPEATIFNSV
jgi:hypothetical protein